MPAKHHFSAEDDPLTRAMAPPPDETIQERDARIHREREAKRVSDEIDEELRKGHKKGPKPVKILLLGTLKFRLCTNEGTDVFVHRPERIRYKLVPRLSSNRPEHFEQGRPRR